MWFSFMFCDRAHRGPVCGFLVFCDRAHRGPVCGFLLCSVIGLVVVLYVVFLCSDFRSPLSHFFVSSQSVR